MIPNFPQSTRRETVGGRRHCFFFPLLAPPPSSGGKRFPLPPAGEQIGRCPIPPSNVLSGPGGPPFPPTSWSDTFSDGWLPLPPARWDGPFPANGFRTTKTLLLSYTWVPAHPPKTRLFFSLRAFGIEIAFLQRNSAPATSPFLFFQP